MVNQQNVRMCVFVFVFVVVLCHVDDMMTYDACNFPHAFNT